MITKGLTRELLPDGRAFQYGEGTISDKLHSSFEMLINEMIEFFDNELDGYIPDNENFDISSVLYYADKFGLVIPTDIDEDIGRNLIFNKWRYPFGNLNRQTRSYIEQRLRNAGFNVSVHTNNLAIEPSEFFNTYQLQFGDSDLEQPQFNGENAQFGYLENVDVIANSVEYDSYVVGVNNYWATFFIVGDSNAEAIISYDRRVEFRELILSIKPAYSVAFAFVEYSNIPVSGGNQINTVNIYDTTVNEGDVVIINVYLSQQATDVITVDVTTTNGTASEPSDYTDITETLTFNIGDIVQTISIPTVDDGTAEGNEQFNVVLSNPTNAYLGNSSCDVTITENTLPSLSISDVVVDEGQSANCQITLDAPHNQPVSVIVTTIDGTATESDDYNEINQLIVIPAGDTTYNLSISAFLDLILDDNESFTIHLSNPTNAIISDGQANVFINDQNFSIPSLIAEFDMTDYSTITTLGDEVSAVSAVNDSSLLLEQMTPSERPHTIIGNNGVFTRNNGIGSYLMSNFSLEHINKSVFIVCNIKSLVSFGYNNIAIYSSSGTSVEHPQISAPSGSSSFRLKQSSSNDISLNIPINEDVIISFINIGMDIMARVNGQYMGQSTYVDNTSVKIILGALISDSIIEGKSDTIYKSLVICNDLDLSEHSSVEQFLISKYNI